MTGIGFLRVLTRVIIVLFMVSVGEFFTLCADFSVCSSVYAEMGSDECLMCHGEKDIEAETARGETLDLYVRTKDLETSVHGDLSCLDCHGEALSWEEAPHNDGKPVPLKCDQCHDKEEAEYHKSIHGLMFSRGDTSSATCSDCHAKHTIRAAKDPLSTTNKFNIHKTCAVCHQDEHMLKTHNITQKEAVNQFVDSIHGRALLVDGLIVAPSCVDCHGVHDILPSTHPLSRISQDNVPETCGVCHVGIAEVYNKSIHGQLHLTHDRRSPTCISCHTSHEIDVPGQTEFRLKSDRVCGSCHMDRLANYRDTLHGKALALGRGEVAACFDCHGHHDIVNSVNLLSPISEERRLETCKKCHPAATANFANYLVHADHTNKDEYPQLYYVFWFMTLLLVGTFAFFAIHSLLWLFRSFALFYRDSKEFHRNRQEIKEDPIEFVRFTPIDRFLHGLIIISFILLVITGMPLKFFYTGWARWLLDFMGGQEVAAVLHRLGAIITIFYFSVHVLTVLYSVIKGRDAFKVGKKHRFSLSKFLAVVFGPDSPMPRFQDLKDMINHNRWFFGKGEKPQFDRWTYWEKFDYLAVFWGVVIIGSSGLILWFPELFTRFLPGWIINVALIIHSDEALLAAGFIFTFHFFNVHFRPEKFPMDTVIFSGRISKAELLHERKRLYDRWNASGELDKHRVKDEWEARKWIAIPFGVSAFIIGVVLVVLIFLAMITRLATG